MASPTLPPDQSLRTYTRDQRLVILSVAEDGLRIGMGTNLPTFVHTDFIKGVYLFTENLVITSDVRAPFGLTAATWTLVGPSGGVNLDASGIQGSLGTPGSPNGAPGGRGGNLGLYVQDLDDTAAEVLTLLAHGGTGGDTHDSNASVGDGGDGGIITTVLQPTYLRVRNSVEEYLSRSEFQSLEDRDTIVSMTHSLSFATMDLLVVGLGLSASNDTITEVFGALRAKVDEIKDEKDITIRDLHHEASVAKLALSRRISKQVASTAPSLDDVRGGFPGSGSGVEVAEGKRGRDGEPRPTFLGADLPNSNLVEAQLPFAHPEQCGMLLERANILFYMGSPTLRDRAGILYQRLIERLGFIPMLESSHPLYQAYQQSEIMPSTWLDDLTRIRRSASDRLVQLNSGKADFYGQSPQWTPRASYTFYKTFLDDALRDFQSFEDAYIKYNAALKDQEDLTDKIKLASDNTSQMVSSLEMDIDDLWLGLQDLNGKIFSAKFVVEMAQRELMDAYEAEKAKIQTAFGLGIPQIINAFTSIAFAPAKGMVGVQAGALLYQGFTSIPTVNGGTVTKDFLASRFTQGEATISNISLDLKETIDGTFQLDEAFRARLLVEKEQILSQLDSFSSQALGGVDDEGTRKGLKEKFDTYIDTVTKRNDSIFQYNVKVKLLQEKSTDKTEYENKQRELENKQVTHNDPDLPVITAYVGAIYQSSRLLVMKLLNTLTRSLRFRMLNSGNVVAFAFGTEDPKLDVPLSLTSTVLTAARGNVEAEFNKQVEIWGSEPIRFPSEFDNRPGENVPGKRYHLKDAFREQLIDTFSVAVTIPPVLQGTTSPGDFGGCCNVRVYRARFGFTGLKVVDKVKDGETVLVQVKLTHGGDESIVNRSNVKVDFEHDPISTIFSFHLRKDGTMTVEDDGNIAFADINNTATSFAAPGPFTEWTVDLEHTEFDKLDFSGVTDAYFDFSGTNYAFL